MDRCGSTCTAWATRTTRTVHGPFRGLCSVGEKPRGGKVRIFCGLGTLFRCRGDSFRRREAVGRGNQVLVVRPPRTVALVTDQTTPSLFVVAFDDCCVRLSMISAIWDLGSTTLIRARVHTLCVARCRWTPTAARHRTRMVKKSRYSTRPYPVTLRSTLLDCCASRARNERRSVECVQRYGRSSH